MRKGCWMLAVAVLLAVAACGGDDDDDGASGTTTSSPGGTEQPTDFQLRSPAFEEGAPFPVRFTCDGENISPPLAWTGVPADAESLALIVNDPDAGTPGFVHWLMWAVPGEDAAIAAGKVPL